MELTCVQRYGNCNGCAVLQGQRGRAHRLLSDGHPANSVGKAPPPAHAANISTPFHVPPSPNFDRAERAQRAVSSGGCLDGMSSHPPRATIRRSARCKRPEAPFCARDEWLSRAAVLLVDLAEQRAIIGAYPQRTHKITLVVVATHGHRRGQRLAEEAWSGNASLRAKRRGPRMMDAEPLYWCAVGGGGQNTCVRDTRGERL